MEQCQICRQREAQIDITGIVNGKETSLIKVATNGAHNPSESNQI